MKKIGVLLALLLVCIVWSIIKPSALALNSLIGIGLVTILVLLAMIVKSKR